LALAGYPPFWIGLLIPFKRGGPPWLPEVELFFNWGAEFKVQNGHGLGTQFRRPGGFLPLGNSPRDFFLPRMGRISSRRGATALGGALFFPVNFSPRRAEHPRLAGSVHPGVLPRHPFRRRTLPPGKETLLQKKYVFSSRATKQEAVLQRARRKTILWFCFLFILFPLFFSCSPTRRHSITTYATIPKATAHATHSLATDTTTERHNS